MEKIGNDYHIPVLYYETLDNLVINPDGVYIDCTLGGGSHSEGILERLSDKGLLLSIDQDSNAIEYSKKRLEKYASKWKVLKGNFENENGKNLFIWYCYFLIKILLTSHQNGDIIKSSLRK